jgi:tetratricopeptide (TPR) repeat protein
MGFFDKLFGRKKEESVPTASQLSPEQTRRAEVPQEKVDPANDPNLIKVTDEYGREMYVSRQEWRDNVLLESIEKHRDDADSLYSLLARAVQDGFAADVVPYAEHLHEIDPVPARGTVLLANVYVEAGRPDDAQQVLEEQMEQHGEDAVILTNLARVFSLHHQEERVIGLLWQALELDPNLEAALTWYAGIQRQRHGTPASELDAYRRIAELPGSWRARLMLARHALQEKDFGGADAYYQEALTLAGDPVPSDLLMQMSGDLGNNGYLADILRLVAPHYRLDYHGLQVGNNLMKALVELGRLDEAREVLKLLYAHQRADWKEGLDHWETEIAKAEAASKAAQQQGKPLALAVVSIEGPLWVREGSPFASLLAPKRERAPRVAVFGSTALVQHGAGEPELQLANAIGRLSRSVPLMLTELIHLTTDAIGVALIPWAQGKGFALFGSEYSDKAICEMAGQGEGAPEYVLGVTIDATGPVWQVHLRLLRGVLATRIAEHSVEVKIDNQGALIENLSKLVDDMLTKQTGVSLADPPDWYQLPSGYGGADYLMRLEQQLTLICKNQDFLEGGDIFGEREILDGALKLCADQPRNPTVRMLLAQTLRMMKKARPEILPEYREKTARLQRELPIREDVAALVDEALAEAFAG